MNGIQFAVVICFMVAILSACACYYLFQQLLKIKEVMRAIVETYNKAMIIIGMRLNILEGKKNEHICGFDVNNKKDNNKNEK